MLREGIPFRLEGGDDVSVLENKWVTCLLGWMNLAAGRLADRAYVGEADIGSVIGLKKVLDTPPIGLSWDGTNALCRLVLAKPGSMDGFADFVRDGLQKQDGALSEKIYRLGKLWKEVRALSSNPNIDPHFLLSELLLALDVRKSIYRLANKPEDADDQWELVEAFEAYVLTNGKGKSLKQFLDHIADLRSFSERAKESTEAIHMTSIHRSKGLEWSCVVMIGLSQGGFPLKLQVIRSGV